MGACAGAKGETKPTSNDLKADNKNDPVK